MRIALAQTDPLIADLDGIAATIHDHHRRAQAAGADLLVFPELAALGYPPRDLLDRRRLVAAQWTMVERLATEITVPTLIGCVHPLGADARSGYRIANALALVRDGRVESVYHKRLLPVYDVFDEARYFRSGDRAAVVEVAGARVGLSVCEDIWSSAFHGTHYDQDPVGDLQGACDLLINVAASPHNAAKPELRRAVVAGAATRLGVPVVYVNQVGGMDELLFDGDSHVVGPEGSFYAVAPRWQPAQVVADLACTVPPPPAIDEYADLHRALVTGLQDYCRKTGQERVVLGLSGGIDSAVTAVLAVDALGADRVTGLLMPGPYSSPGSVADAEALAANLGIRTWTCPIVDANQAVLDTLTAPFAGTAVGVAEENIQARLRGLMVMALANKLGAMALTTGNKSELAVGYCTIYGDMNGGLAPIGDVYKSRVFRLARHLNRERERIPEASITKPPSAELRPDQRDTDSLPAYDDLDRILEGYLECDEGPAALVAAGCDPQAVARMIRLVEINEYKRRQAAPALRVTGKAFGVGRRIPLARAMERP